MRCLETCVKSTLPLLQLHALALASSLLLGSAAQAQTSPYYIGLSQTLGYDSNVFRRSDRTVTVDNPANPGTPLVLKPESSGLISTTSLIAGIDQPIGRQRVYANGRLGYASYGDQPQLDAPVYSLRAGLDWETVERLSGKVEVAANQSQGPYETRQVDELSEIVTRASGAKLTDNTERALLVVRLGAGSTSRWWLEGGLRYSHLNRESDFGPYAVGTAQWIGYRQETTSTGFSLAARNRLSGALTVGAGISTSDRDSTSAELWVNDLPPPNVPLADVDDSRRNNIDFFADWIATGASTVRGRLSFGEVRYDDASDEPDSSRWSGDVSWDWQPTGKTNMTTRLTYDQEDRELGFDPGSDDRGGDYYTSLRWNGQYIATGKVNVNASLGLVWRPFENSRTEDGVRFRTDGSDDDFTLSLGFTYQALRSVSSGCSIEYFSQKTSSTRYVTRPTGTSSAPFENKVSAYMPSCFVQVMLQ
jgi:hypothetical protein